jgi:hypothetical protein
MMSIKDKVVKVFDTLISGLVATLGFLFASLVLFFWFMVVLVIIYHIIKALSKLWS